PPMGGFMVGGMGAPVIPPLRGGPRLGGAGDAPFKPVIPPRGGGGEEKGDDAKGAKEPAKPGETRAKVLDNAALVDLTVYGVATLYERFPAPPKKTATTPPKP
ncbi:MAG: hypothetical protein K2W96_18330, partial [Gemmataceae bacterium]|nr:hypothetical protein [Gemmataceae bacterium]